MAMPAKFEPLALYNSERARGLVHTPEWQDAMCDLDAEFQRWVRTNREELVTLFPIQLDELLMDPPPARRRWFRRV